MKDVNNIKGVSKNEALRLNLPFHPKKYPRKTLDDRSLAETYANIDSNIRIGYAEKAEKICQEALQTYTFSLDIQSQLYRRLSITYEMQGRFKEALEAVKPFEENDAVKNLNTENLAAVFTQLALTYIEYGDSEKSINLLNVALRIAEERDFSELLVNINLAFVLLYRKLNEFSIARNYVDKALKYARDVGDWIGMTNAYRLNATTYCREGNCERSIELYRQALRMVGDREAPYLLGKTLSSMSVAYYAMHLPQDGIGVLKKAINQFELIDNKYCLAIAYNNLGSNLILNGDWSKAEQVLDKSIDLALSVNHGQLANIVDTIGELNLLRGDYDEAEKLFTQAFELNSEKQNVWYSIQISYHLARCLLEKKNYAAAIQKAQETVAICERINENQFRLLSTLISAEGYLKQNKSREADDILSNIEENEINANYLIQGFRSRIQGLIALQNNDEALAVYHLKRSLASFDISSDFYQIAVASFELGKAYIESHTDSAKKHLTVAHQLFLKLKLQNRVAELYELLKSLENIKKKHNGNRTSKAYFLTLRLTEAASSREFLLRELISTLRAEGKAKKIVIAELNDKNRFYPTFTDGYAPAESILLIDQLNEAQLNNSIDEFANSNRTEILHLRPNNSPSALVLIYPPDGALLSDGSSIQPLLKTVELGLEVCSLREKTKDLPSKIEFNSIYQQSIMPGFIHTSPVMMAVIDEILKIQTSDITVLITGESGTGKELVAKAVHHVSRRKNKTFVPFNCTAVPKELTEGHLFGYKKGAFTGANNDSDGMIRAADGGTLFLDEIGDLPLDVQPKILRFLQEGEVQPLGEKSPKKVDVRIIAATNMRIEEMVSQGSFREDLYYRLNVIRLHIPPLRERRSEIPQLVEHFINVYSEKFGRSDLTMSSEAMDLLIAFNWHGNVRQLCNEVQRIVARSNNGDLISPNHLSAEIKPVAESRKKKKPSPKEVRTVGVIGGSISVRAEGCTLEEAVSSLEAQMIQDSLKRNKFSVTKVSKELGMTRRGVYMKIERYSLESS